MPSSTNITKSGYMCCQCAEKYYKNENYSLGILGITLVGSHLMGYLLDFLIQHNTSFFLYLILVALFSDSFSISSDIVFKETIVPYQMSINFPASKLKRSVKN